MRHLYQPDKLSEMIQHLQKSKYISEAILKLPNNNFLLVSKSLWTNKIVKAERLCCRCLCLISPALGNTQYFFINSVQKAHQITWKVLRLQGMLGRWYNLCGFAPEFSARFEYKLSTSRFNRDLWPSGVKNAGWCGPYSENRHLFAPLFTRVS